MDTVSLPVVVVADTIRQHIDEHDAVLPIGLAYQILNALDLDHTR